MSTIKTFLVLVFSDWDPNWRDDLLIFDEEDGVRVIADAGIAPFPYKRERHLFFELQQPLNQEQVYALEEARQSGIFKQFSVRDEIIQTFLGDPCFQAWGGKERHEVQPYLSL